jgi:DNA-binding MarR family transcriptional regulator
MKLRDDDIEQVVTGLLEVGHQLQQARRGQGEGSRLVILQRIAGRDDDVRPSDLAAELKLSLSSVTRQLRTLQDAGFVGLAEDPRDRRSCLVTLTGSGREETDRLNKIAFDRFVEFVADWDPDELRKLGELLNKLAGSINQTTTAKKGPAGPRWRGQS